MLIDRGVVPVIVMILPVTSPTVIFMPVVASMSLFFFVSGHREDRAGDVADRDLHAVGRVDVTFHLSYRCVVRRTTSTAARALEIDFPVVAMHDRLGAGQPLNVRASASMVEVVVAE